MWYLTATRTLQFYIREKKDKQKWRSLSVSSLSLSLDCNSPVIFFKLFDAQIAPTLLYAAEIRGYKLHEQIERVHLLHVKYFCMCVKRPRMTLSAENWPAIHCLYLRESDLSSIG